MSTVEKQEIQIMHKILIAA